MRLEQGSVLFYSPKGKGGGAITSGGASAAVLGSTMICAVGVDGGFKTIFLEGKKCKVTLKNGKSVTLHAGQMVVVLPGGEAFGPVLDIDLAKLVQPGRKNHRKAVHDAYPLARLTLAAELAAMPMEELERIPWYQRGNTRVFLYKQRKIRERTINKEREKNEIKSSSGERCDAHRIPPGLNAPELNSRGATDSSSAERRIARPPTGRNGSDAFDSLSADIKALQEVGRRRYARIQMPSIRLGG